MVGLLDIAPAKVLVPVGSGSVEVCGVSVKGVAALLSRFPELKEMLSQGSINAEYIIEIAPDAIASIIAIGVGHPGDAVQEEAASRLDIGSQLDLLEAILLLTFPKGLGPFVERLVRMGVLSGAEEKPEQLLPEGVIDIDRLKQRAQATG